MSTPSELIEVTEALNDWRANKRAKFERIPPELLRRARRLRGGAISDREICKTTRLSWMQLIPKTKKRVTEFVEIPAIMASDPVVVEIHDGARSVIIRFGPSVDVEKLVSQFYP